MGRMIDAIYEKILELREEPSLIIDETCVMEIVKSFRKELPPFEECFEFLCGSKSQNRVTMNGAKLLSMKEQLQELLHIVNATNLETFFLMENLGLVWVNEMTSNLTGKKQSNA